MNECIECGRPYSEDHHIVHRSQAPYMVKVKLNKIRLCSYHHREDKKSPHKDIKKDLEYKRDLQAKYEIIFCNSYYTLEEIKLKLEISQDTLYDIVKLLTVHKEGFERIALIRRLMGGKLY